MGVFLHDLVRVRPAIHCFKSVVFKEREEEDVEDKDEEKYKKSRIGGRGPKKVEGMQLTLSRRSKLPPLRMP